MQVSADVSESDIGMCKVGQPVRFTVDAYPEQTFRGTIAQIRLNATVNQNVVTYPVIIEVPNPELALRPSMTANVSIDVATVQRRAAGPERRAALPAGGDGGLGRLGRERRVGRGARGPRRAGPGPPAAARQFDRSAGPGGGKPRRPGPDGLHDRVPGTDGALKPVEIRAGITDGRLHAGRLGGELKEGETVVVGLATAKADAAAAPPAQRPGGPGGRRF